MPRSTRAVIIFFAAFVIAACGARGCMAAGVGFSIDRAVLDYALLPGIGRADFIKLVNQSGSQPLPMAISFLAADMSADSEEIEYLDTEPEVNPLAWIHASTTELILQPGEERRFYFSLDIPALAPPGSYLVMIKFSTFFPNTSGETGVLEMPEVRIPLFIKVARLTLEGTGERYAAELNALAANAKGGSKVTLWDGAVNKAEAAVVSAVPEAYSVTIKNSGGYHFKSAGTLLIKNIFGQTVQTIPLPERYLLPGKSRTLTLSLAEAADGLRRFDTASVSGGRYTLELLLKNPNLAESQYLIDSHLSFWVVPWQRWLIVLLAALAVVFLSSRLRGRIGPALRALEGKTP